VSVIPSFEYEIKQSVTKTKVTIAINLFGMAYEGKALTDLQIAEATKLPVELVKLLREQVETEALKIEFD